MPIVTAEERVGSVLARKYRLDRILGEGGMGVVYAGRHIQLDRPVAVKFLHAQYARNAQVVARFFSEAQAAARLKHDNVVDVYDLDQAEDGAVFMVLEFLEGEALSAFLARAPRLDLAQLSRLLVPVLDALSRAHESGIVHRDLKPDNIFLSRDRDGRTIPKVLDFGIAKLVDATRGGATTTGTIVGTPAYMAPEQAMGRKDIGPWTDVWSMGVVLYEALTGRYPFDIDPEMSSTAVIVNVVSSPAHPLRRFWPEAPAHVAECVDRALAKEPVDRWQSMRQLHEALEGSSSTLVRTRVDEAPVPLVVVRTPPARVGPPSAATPFGWSSMAERPAAAKRGPALLAFALLVVVGAGGTLWALDAPRDAPGVAAVSPTAVSPGSPTAVSPSVPVASIVAADAGALLAADAGMPAVRVAVPEQAPEQAPGHAHREERSRRVAAAARADPTDAPEPTVGSPSVPAARAPRRTVSAGRAGGEFSDDQF